jgi:hypothetical protein
MVDDCVIVTSYSQSFDNYLRGATLTYLVAFLFGSESNVRSCKDARPLIIAFSN